MLRLGSHFRILPKIVRPPSASTLISNCQSQSPVPERTPLSGPGFLLFFTCCCNDDDLLDQSVSGSIVLHHVMADITMSNSMRQMSKGESASWCDGNLSEDPPSPPPPPHFVRVAAKASNVTKLARVQNASHAVGKAKRKNSFPSSGCVFRFPKIHCRVLSP